MTEKQFNSIVNNAVKHGNQYRKQIDKLAEWAKEKYGLDWNELDCDDIIDALEFGCGYLSKMTFEEFKTSIESKL